jgi:soluble lytic murein transglycosylase-like protein
MQRLHFSTSARKRARLHARIKRFVVAGWIYSMIALVVGLPGATSGLALVDELASRARLIPSESDPSVDLSQSATSAMRFRRAVFDVRPAPEPPAEPEPAEAAPVVAPVPVAPAGSIEAIIYAAAANHGLSGSYLLAVASCESGLDPNAYNAAGYHGLFQFDQTTWGEFGYGSIYDPVAQSETAAGLIAAGQASRWPNCA